ncbi:MAG: type IV pilus assembly protein PilM [Candidatus Melainabacteria bacterium]|nr:MAG: type IV pilus assembly protein PilM [Candidatus Melainabacteria bacterium]
MNVFSFGKKKGPTLGLDINSDSITLIQLDKTRSGIEVARFACQPTPANAIREGLIADPETVGQLLMDLLASASIPVSGPSPVINVAVPAQAVVIRLMPVPVGMPPEELADVVTQEATNHVPFPIEDANLDWSQMPATERTDADGVRRIDVILAAIQRSIIESYWRMADSAGVRLGKVDISSLSVVRSLALAGYLGSSGHLSMIVNIRHDATDINVVRSAMPLFGRSIMLGIDTLTEALSRSLEINFDEALDLLPEIALFNVNPTDFKMGQASQVARTIFSDITDELQRSLDFYKSQVGDVKVDQIILTGPGCMIPQLDQYISNRMNIKTILSDPMRDLIFSPDIIVDSMRPILAALIGSSIETSWNPSFTVDLDLNKEGRLPLLYDERKTQVIAPDERPTPWFKAAIAAGIAALALSLASYGFITQFDIPNKQRQIDQLAERTVQSNADLKQLSALRKENDVLTNKKKILDNIVKKSNHWSTVLNSIRTSIPGSVQIESVIIEDGATIEGNAMVFEGISNYAINLSTAPGFTDALIQSASRKEKTPEIIFYQIRAKLAGHDEPGSSAPTTLADGKTDAHPGNPLPNVLDGLQNLPNLKKPGGAM